MKITFFTLLFLTIANLGFSQTRYSISKISHKSVSANGTVTNAPYIPVSKRTAINLFNNALTVDGESDLYFKFIRKTILTDKTGDSYPRWDAIDKYDHDCQIIIKSFGSFTRIGIQYAKSGQLDVYQTY